MENQILALATSAQSCSKTFDGATPDRRIHPGVAIQLWRQICQPLSDFVDRR
jgi:hypothetical protein